MVHVQPSGLERLMTLSPCFAIRTPLFNSFLISIADTRTFNSPLNLNRTKRFLFLMLSSNAILTTLSPHPSTERKRSLIFKLNGNLSHLGNTRFSYLIRTLTYRCLRICSSPCLLQSALDDLRGICHAMGTPVGLFLIT